MSPTLAFLDGTAGLAYFAVPVVLIVLLWKSLVLPPERTDIALLRDGELVRIVDETTLTIPFITEKRGIPTGPTAVDVDPVSFETTDGVPVELDPQIILEVEDPETFVAETESAGTIADEIEADVAETLEQYAGRDAYSEEFEDLRDRVERTVERHTRRSGLTIAEISLRPSIRDEALPDFFPYHERFDRDEGGQLYATVEGNRVPIEDVFYDGSTDIVDLKLLDVDLDRDSETVESDEGAEVERTHISVPGEVESSWDGAPRFGPDGEPFTTTLDGQRLSLYDLLDGESVPGVTVDSAAAALRDSDHEPESLMVWASGGSVTMESVSLLDALAAA